MIWGVGQGRGGSRAPGDALPPTLARWLTAPVWAPPPPPSPAPCSKVYICRRYPKHHCSKWCPADTLLLQQQPQQQPQPEDAAPSSSCVAPQPQQQPAQAAEQQQQPAQAAEPHHVQQDELVDGACEKAGSPPRGSQAPAPGWAAAEAGDAELASPVHADVGIVASDEEKTPSQQPSAPRAPPGGCNTLAGGGGGAPPPSACCPHQLAWRHRWHPASPSTLPSTCSRPLQEHQHHLAHGTPAPW